MNTRRALTLVAGLSVAAAAATVTTRRRWGQAADATGGLPLCLPDGDERRVRTPDGAQLAVTVAGRRAPNGTTFVLAHCWTGDRRLWGPVARRLAAEGHEVVLYDHRGHGESTVGDAGLTIEALAADLRSVLEAVDARDAVVGGHSMGGMAAQALAAESPDVIAERVRALVLVATACTGLSIRDGLDRFACRTVASSLAQRAVRDPRIGPYLVRGALGRRPAAAHLRAVQETFSAAAAPSRGELLAAMYRMDFSKALAALEVPVTVVVGSHDRLTPQSHSRRLAELLPRAELLVVPDAGHMLPCEAPDELARVLLAAAR